MSLKRFGIAAAMEQLEEEQEAVAAADTPADTTPAADAPVEAAPVEAVDADVPAEELDIPVAEDTVESAVSGMDLAENEVEQADAAISDAEADEGTLIDVADKLEATEETGGLDAGSAAVVEVAVEALYQRLGVVRNKAMPAMESFGSTSSRKKATSIAVENIREQAKKVGQAILMMIQKAWEFISNFFEKIFTASGRAKERAVKLKEALAQLEGKTSSATDVDGSAFGKALVLAYKPAITAENIVTGLGNTDSEGIKKILARSLISAEGLSDFQAMVAATPEEFAKKLAPQFDFSSFERIVDASDYDKPIEGVAYYAVTGNDGLLGGVDIAIMAKEVITEDFNSVAAAVKTTRVIIKNRLSEEQQESEKYAKLPTLSLEDGNKIVDAAIAALDHVAVLKKNEEAIKKAGEVLRKTLSGETFSMLMDKELSGEEKGDAAAGYFVFVRSAIKTLTALASQPLFYLGKTTVVSATAALQYVALSAKTYGAEEKAPEAAAPAADAAPAAA